MAKVTFVASYTDALGKPQVIKSKYFEVFKRLVETHQAAFPQLHMDLSMVVDDTPMATEEAKPFFAKPW